MTSRVNIRQSKFRHLFGTAFQLRDCYQAVKVGSVGPDANPIKANRRFFAVPWAVTGAIAVVPLSAVGSVVPTEDDLPPMLLHEQTVADFAFHPFDECVLASACNDGAARLWRIPETGLSKNLSQEGDALATLQCGSKRLLGLEFHPTAYNVLATHGADFAVRLWDVGESKEVLQLPAEHAQLLTSLSWSHDGTLLATSSKDKTIRVFDPRQQQSVGSAPDHQGAKSGRLCFLGRREQLLSVGFTRDQNREAAIHDPRKLGATPLAKVTIDNSTSSLLPIYDDDLSLLYLAGKGDGNIRFYEIADDAPLMHFLNEFKTNQAQVGVARLPKQSCNVSKCEVLRILKLQNTSVVPVRFEVPRRESDFFQPDLFPDTWDLQATAQAPEWFAGTNGTRATVSLKPEGAL